MAKARAKYGKRLTAQNYRDLLACRSVNDVADYLKSNTVYAASLSPVKSPGVHRAQLEHLLRRHLFSEYESLCRFEMSAGEPFFEYIIMTAEIGELLTFIRMFNAGRTAEYILGLPAFLETHANIDLRKLSAVRGYDGLLDALKGTEYHKLFLPVRPDQNGHLDYTLIEYILHSFLLKKSLALAGSLGSKSARQETRDSFGIMTDMSNISRVYRCKKFFDLPGEEISKLLFPCVGRLSAKTLAAMVDAGDPGEVLTLLRKSPYGGYLEGFEYSHIEQCVDRVQHSAFRRALRFSANPSEALLAFVVLARLEVENIIIIIESVRYGYTTDKISERLVM